LPQNSNQTNDGNTAAQTSQPKKTPTIPAPTLNPSDPTIVGTAVTLSITIKGSDNVVPTGKVDFQVKAGSSDWSNIVTGVSLKNGSASASYTPMVANSYQFQVVYYGDDNYSAKTGDTANLTVKAAGQSNQFSLTILSAHGSPNPPNGVVMKDSGTQVTCSVVSPSKEGFKFWKCIGWEGEGSVPKTEPNQPKTEPSKETATEPSKETATEPSKEEVASTVTFPILKDTWIKWKWQSISAWAAFEENPVWENQAISVAILIAIFVLASVDFYSLHRAFFLAILGGGIGGLIHEFAQSYGKFLLPTTDDKGTQCLGTLIGIAAGAVAGLLVYEGLLPGASVGPKLVASAIIAGLAGKGLADAPTLTLSKSATSGQSQPSQSSSTTQPTQT